MSTSENGRKLIMVIEDDDITRNLLAILLEEEGYRTVTVADGNDAISMIQSLQPDLVTLDLSLPGKGGAEILRELQLTQHASSLPVIVLSALSAYLPSELRVLADSVIDKPFNLQELLNAVDKAMGNGHEDLGHIA